jgi:hypothetical protein
MLGKYRLNNQLRADKRVRDREWIIRFAIRVGVDYDSYLLF